MSDPIDTISENRRGFLKQGFVTLMGAVLALVPLGAGLGVLFEPLQRKQSAGILVRVTSLAALPADGVPRSFPVTAIRHDAWTTYAAAPVGAVFLRRTSANKVEAFNAACPHAGCHVQYLAQRKGFLCPCHKGTFTVDGQIADPKSPARRGLDTLAVEIRKGGEVWVRFENFLPGRAEKVPVA